MLAKRTVPAFALLTVVLTTVSCASIVEGRRQMINVSTTYPDKGQCTLRDTKGVTYNVQTPGAVVVNRGDGPLDVNCTLPDSQAQGKSTVGEGVEPWIIGNVLFGLGGIIGIGIDAYTGAYQKYNDNVLVQVQPTNAGSRMLEFNQSTPIIPQ